MRAAFVATPLWNIRMVAATRISQHSASATIEKATIATSRSHSAHKLLLPNKLFSAQEPTLSIFAKMLPLIPVVVLAYAALYIFT